MAARWLTRSGPHGTAQAADATNEPFTAEEQADIARSLDEVKQLVRDRFDLTGGSCLGEYQIDRQPSVRQLTYLCPMPAPFCCAGWQSQGIQPTVTRPGPQGCPWLHWVG
jgi:hypothetical protein